MGFGRQMRYRKRSHQIDGNFTSCRLNKEYIIKAIETNEHEIKDFLFTLGCYEGEKITVISMLANQYVVVLKDARYSIDQDLANCIMLSEC